MPLLAAFSGHAESVVRVESDEARGRTALEKYGRSGTGSSPLSGSNSPDCAARQGAGRSAVAPRPPVPYTIALACPTENAGSFWWQELLATETADKQQLALRPSCLTRLGAAPRRSSRTCRTGWPREPAAPIAARTKGRPFPLRTGGKQRRCKYRPGSPDSAGCDTPALVG